ncbi:MAG TPA: bifunctional phosphoribosyl-AMP cyclohydrolase/phosphoribosyl-ATP diphosphatase HisIE [Bacteroidota bacterium]|nr:bifunctional phosphoribosyl-AMP cyclohydrolase/phosphoribosyl-ATP diphosphatase HisIE [Bacteroidota bacterium]
MTEEIDFAKMNGLVPAVVQDANTGVVLMVGFMNKDAYEQTLREKAVVFWSRSRQRLWKKGETSGNILDLVSIHPDCDRDALLVRAVPRGPVCHTGERSCFGLTDTGQTLATLGRLAAIIRSRKKELPEKSYTADLFRKGLSRIGQKVGEEGVELAIAAQYPERKRCIEETADLFYHTLVLLEAKEIELKEVMAELEVRMAK